MPHPLCFLSPTILAYCKQEPSPRIQSIVTTHPSVCHLPLQNTAMRIFMNGNLWGRVSASTKHNVFLHIFVIRPYPGSDILKDI